MKSAIIRESIFCGDGFGSNCAKNQSEWDLLREQRNDFSRDGIRRKLFQKSFSVVGCVLELEALKDNLFLVVDKRSDVKIFTDVDTQIEHFYHLKKIFRSEFL